MDKNTEKQETVKEEKGKAMQEDLVSAKKRKEELEICTKKVIDMVDKKGNEAEKRKDITHLKALLIESNKIQKKDIPAQEKKELMYNKGEGIGLNSRWFAVIIKQSYLLCYLNLR